MSQWMQPSRETSQTSETVRYSAIRLMVASGFVLLGAVMQGCLAVAWVTAVTVDLTRSSDVEFQPFENSWTAPKETWLRHRPTKGIAVALESQLGDPFASVLQQQLTSFRVVIVGDSSLMAPPSPTLRQREAAQLETRARAIIKRFEVDAVLVGNVVESPAEEMLLGLKARSSKRLYLRLLNKDGRVIWRSELPFVVVQGDKPLNQDDVENALERHLNSAQGDFRLPELIISDAVGYAS
jgi:hypothetical protein